MLFSRPLGCRCDVKDQIGIQHIRHCCVAKSAVDSLLIHRGALQCYHATECKMTHGRRCELIERYAYQFHAWHGTRLHSSPWVSTSWASPDQHVGFLCAELPHAVQDLVPRLLSSSTRPIPIKACYSSFGHRPIRTGMADVQVAHQRFDAHPETCRTLFWSLIWAPWGT